LRLAVLAIPFGVSLPQLSNLYLTHYDMLE
jgi:hypothetical protein